MYIIREVYIAMFVIRIIQLTIAFNHSYHTCKFDIDWISILLKISKINANFDIIAACSSSRNRDSSPTRQFADTHFEDSSPTELKTVHRQN